MKIIVALFCFSLCSCVWTKDVKALGGRGVHRSDTGAFLAWNAEKSFYHGSVAAVALGGSIASTVASNAKEATARHGAEQATKQHAATQATARNAQNVGGNVVNTANGINGGLEVPAQIVTPSGY